VSYKVFKSVALTDAVCSLAAVAAGIAPAGIESITVIAVFAGL
jgi:hypothetical protein